FYDFTIETESFPCLAQSDDVYEPNDTFQSAAQRPANSTSFGITLGDNRDYYGFTVGAGETQTVDLLFSNAAADLDFFVASLAPYESVGTAFSNTDDETLTFTNMGSTDRDYIVSIYRDLDSEGVCANYSLVLSNSGPPSSIVPFCFGDGSGTACPCSNNSSAGHPGGCAHQSGDGAVLVGSGTPSLSADSLHFDLSSAVQNSFAILVSGVNALPQMGCVGCGIVAFDGLRCAGGDFRRHGSRALNALGVANNGWGPPAGPPGGLGAVSNVVAGQTRNYTAFFRTDAASTCGTGQSSSNGVAVTWAP
ncbi:MAG: hypothetical protein AAF368_13185, partial [Planctomycetota bacterium]